MCGPVRLAAWRCCQTGPSHCDWGGFPSGLRHIRMLINLRALGDPVYTSLARRRGPLGVKDLQGHYVGQARRPGCRCAAVSMKQISMLL